MDFLKSYAEAKNLGLTKEEFMHQWEAQINATRLQAESRLLELRQQVNMPPQYHAEREMNLAALIEGPLNIVQQEINNLRLECQQRFETLQSQITHLTSQQEVIRLKMVEECSVNLDSMKVYVQNEVQLLSDSIERKIDLNSKDKTSDISGAFLTPNSGAFLTPNSGTFLPPNSGAFLPPNSGAFLTPLSPQTVQISSTENAIEQFQHFYQQQEGSQEHFFNQVGHGHQLQQEDNFVQTPVPIMQEQAVSATNNFEFGWDSTMKPKDDVAAGKIHTGMSYAAVAALEAAHDFVQILKPGVDDGTNGYLASGIGESELAILQNVSHPILATGQYAEIISRRMAVKKQGARSRSLGKSGPLVPHNAGKILKLPKASRGSSVTPMSLSGEEFKIPDCLKFYNSKTDYYTHHFYTSSLRCKVRLRVSFNDKCFFNVSLLVSQCPDDSSTTWPVLITGKGEIFNHGSRKYTPLWDFGLSTCPKPSPSEEISFEASVRLTTSRGVYDEVTYELLQAKRYDFEDSLDFRWNVTVQNNC